MPAPRLTATLVCAALAVFGQPARATGQLDGTAFTAGFRRLEN